MPAPSSTPGSPTGWLNVRLVAWDDGTRQVPQVALRISEDGGRSFGERTALSAANRAARFPVLGVYGDSLVVAWSEESAAEAERARASRPDMKTPGATMGLEPVGSARVLARRGVLQ